MTTLTTTSRCLALAACLALLPACSGADTTSGPALPGPGPTYGYDAYVPPGQQPPPTGGPIADGGGTTPPSTPASDGATEPPPGEDGCTTAGQIRCDGTCVNAQSDPKHCGACNATCASGLCQAGACVASTRECEYYQDNVCGGDQTQWCGSGKCVPCQNGRFNCDKTGGCECETGCDNDRCTDPVCDREVVGSCGTDPTQWCYHKDGYDQPGQCKTCSTSSHTRGFNCDGLGKTGCECQSKEIYVSGTGYTGQWSHECQSGQCVKIN